MKITLKKLICGYGETGKHVWFRSICRETCRFKSCYPHHRSNPYIARLWAFLLAKEKQSQQKSRCITSSYASANIHFGINYLKEPNISDKLSLIESYTHSAKGEFDLECRDVVVIVNPVLVVESRLAVRPCIS